MPRGGRRRGAGRKPGVTNELRLLITEQDFSDALEVLRFAMKQRKNNLKSAVSAAVFLIDQKIGKPPQGMDLEESKEKLLHIVVGPSKPIQAESSDA